MSISSISNNSVSQYANLTMRRPDPSQLAKQLFARLDTRDQGFLEKSDLQAAFDQLGSSGSGGSSSNIDQLFSQLDSDSDGKVTQEEMTSTLQKLADQLDSQFNQMRMAGFAGQGGAQGMGQMPPPHGQHGGNSERDNAGFSREQLNSQLQRLDSGDRQRASLISDIVQNFDQADSNGDGKVSRQEAMAFEQTQQAASSATASTSSASSGSSTSSGDGSASSDSQASNARVMQQIMQLMHAYGRPEHTHHSQLASLLSATA